MRTSLDRIEFRKQLVASILLVVAGMFVTWDAELSKSIKQLGIDVRSM